MARQRRPGLVLAAVLLALPVGVAADRVVHRLRDDVVTGPVTPGATGRDAAAAPRPTLPAGNTAPRVTIGAPAVGQTFAVGGVYPLSGSASDVEDGPLPPNAMSWTAVTHQAGTGEVRPLLGPVVGSSTAIIAPAPENLPAATDSWVEVRLTATDSAGLVSTVSRRFDPAKVAVTVATVPTGRTVSVDGRAVPDGTTVTSWAGLPLALGVPEQYDAGGREYGFGSWSDGGAASHPFVTPATGGTVTATLQPGPSGLSGVTVRQSGPTSATISWVPPRDPGGSTLIGYAVRRAADGRAEQSAYAATVGATSQSFTMTGLVPGRPYRLRVNAFNAYAAGPTTTVPVTVGARSADGPRSVTDR